MACWSARERQGRVGEHRRALEAASRRAAEAGGNLQALHAIRAGNAREGDARARLGESGEQRRATSPRSAPPSSSCAPASGRLFAVAENYPQLKTDETFKQLQARITALEESIADRRELYNDQVNLNNIRVKVFPDVLIAQQVRLPAGAAAGIRRTRKSATSTLARCSAPRSPCSAATAKGQSGHVRQSIQILARWSPASPRAAAYSFWYAFKAWAKNRTIEDTPTSRVRSAAQGYVELSGRGVPPPSSADQGPAHRHARAPGGATRSKSAAPAADRARGTTVEATPARRRFSR